VVANYKVLFPAKCVDLTKTGRPKSRLTKRIDLTAESESFGSQVKFNKFVITKKHKI
jgi:hypothetical protein